MIKNGRQKEIRHYVGAIGIFIFVVGILTFLSFHEIPTVNKDIIVSIIGMIVGSLSVVIMTVIGRNPDEVNELKKSNEGLSSKVEHLVQQKDELEKMLGMTRKVAPHATKAETYVAGLLHQVPSQSE